MVEKEQKEKIVEVIGKELPNMTEAGKNYLMGFLEGFSAGAGIGCLAAERPRRVRSGPWTT